MTEAVHLDPARLRALLERRLSRDERAALRRHLATPCDRCEDLLAGSEEVDALDGWVEDAALSLAEPGAARHAPTSLRPTRARAARRAWITAFAAAAAAVFVVVAWPGEESHERLKGSSESAPSAPVRLELLARTSDGALAPLADGASVTQGTVLVFRLALPAPACVRIWRVEPQVEPLQPAAECLDAGAHVVSSGGEALGLAADAEGPLVLAAVPEAGAPGDTAIGAMLSRGDPRSGASLVRLLVVAGKR